jgi:predicted nicotinamide N-methyase
LKTDPYAFIQRNTTVMSPPHVPEIRLHLASEAHELWLKTEDELQEIGLPPPFWAFAWAGGQGLARYILDHPEVVAGKRVVDFASGSGIVAICAALAGAVNVTAVDIDPWAKTAIALNAAENNVRVDFMSNDIVGKAIDADVLLAGDVFYDGAFAALLTPWLSTLKRNGVTVLIGDPGRAYLPQNLLEACAIYQVPVTRVLEDSDVKKTTVWTFV